LASDEENTISIFGQHALPLYATIFRAGADSSADVLMQPKYIPNITTLTVI